MSLLDPVILNQATRARIAAETSSGGAVTTLELTADQDIGQNEGVAISSSGVVKSDVLINKLQDLGSINDEVYITQGHGKLLLYFYNSTTTLNIHCWDIDDSSNISNQQTTTVSLGANQGSPNYKPVVEALTTADKFMISYKYDNSNNDRMAIIDTSSGLTVGTPLTVFNAFKLLELDKINNKVLVRSNTNEFTLYDIDTVGNTFTVDHTDTSVPSLPSPTSNSVNLQSSAFYDGNLYIANRSTGNIQVYRETSPSQWTVATSFSLPSGVQMNECQLRLRSNGDLLIFDDAKGEGDTPRFAIINATTGASITPVIINYRNSDAQSFIMAIEEDDNGDHIMVAFDDNLLQLKYYRLNVTGSDIVSFDELTSIPAINSDYNENTTTNGNNYNNTSNRAFILGGRLSFVTERIGESFPDLETLAIAATGTVIGVAKDAVTSGNTFDVILEPGISGVSVIDTLSGLSPGSVYYIDTDSTITTTGTTRLGIALSSTELLLTRPVTPSDKLSDLQPVAPTSVGTTLTTVLSLNSPNGGRLDGFIISTSTSDNNTIVEARITADDAPEKVYSALNHTKGHGFLDIRGTFEGQLTVQLRCSSGTTNVTPIYKLF